jgi:hypothetical protein
MFNINSHEYMMEYTSCYIEQKEKKRRKDTVLSTLGNTSTTHAKKKDLFYFGRFVTVVVVAVDVVFDCT